MKRIIYLWVLFSFSNSFSQQKSEVKEKREIGLEIQKYPVGTITVITYNYFFKETWAMRFRVGGNFANRKDESGFNDDEKANGFGGSFGINKYVRSGNGNFIFGANVDVWNMWTKWIDYSEIPQNGKTYTLVIQPWINAGYLYNFSKKFNAGIYLGFGREINVITDGENVGQGLMGSLTLSGNYKLN
ncbi:hypothetical protein [Flavobacterium sp.]|uniref:hypothetical protein n=1 Tax=Flavobacterium sp. TaxID=239 RepID=UPI0025E1D339|nr:hypothetical protein [Flavobacterium sp.]